MAFSVLQILIVIMLQLLISILFLFLGFWAGRKTQDKPVFIPDVKDDYKYGEPALEEYDPYVDASNLKEMEKTV